MQQQSFAPDKYCSSITEILGISESTNNEHLDGQWVAVTVLIRYQSQFTQLRHRNAARALEQTLAT